MSRCPDIAMEKMSYFRYTPLYDILRLETYRFDEVLFSYSQRRRRLRQYLMARNKTRKASLRHSVFFSSILRVNQCKASQKGSVQTGPLNPKTPIQGFDERGGWTARLPMNLDTTYVCTGP